MLATPSQPDATTDAIRVALGGVEKLHEARIRADETFGTLSPADQDRIRPEYAAALQRGAEVLQSAQESLLETVRNELGDCGVELIFQAANFESN